MSTSLCLYQHDACVEKRTDQIPCRSYSGSWVRTHERLDRSASMTPDHDAGELSLCKECATRTPVRVPTMLHYPGSASLIALNRSHVSVCTCAEARAMV